MFLHHLLMLEKLLSFVHFCQKIAQVPFMHVTHFIAGVKHLLNRVIIYTANGESDGCLLNTGPFVNHFVFIVVNYLG
jgi:hypothetical protein